MTRGKQKIEAQRRNAERNQKAKGSQLEARAVALKISCPICKISAEKASSSVSDYTGKLKQFRLSGEKLPSATDRALIHSN